MAASTFTVERSIDVDAPPPHVYEQVADLRAWADWSPFEGLDPHLTRAYSGPESGVGAVYAWSGNARAGQGHMAVVDAVRPSHVVIDLVFEKPFRSRNEVVFTIVPDGSGSRVTWTMTGPRTLGTRVMSLLKSMDAILGPDFEKGLARLKQLVEEQAAP